MVEEEKTVLNYSIDSLDITNITEKTILGQEALADKEEGFKKLDEAKELGKQYQSTKLLVDIIKEGEGESNTAKMGINSMNEYKEKADILVDDAKALIAEAKSKAQKHETADSTTVVYYQVFARGTVTSIKNVQKNGTFPFHISKDYKILKEPLEFKKR